MASRTPIIRQVSWIAILPQLFTIAAVMLIGGYFLGYEYGIIASAGAYLAYSIGSRLVISRYHRQGIALVKQQRFAEAIARFKDSLDFFDRHAWIDRFRPIVLMSASAMSYREMALANIAFCYAQIGDGPQARHFYNECLNRFPDNAISTAALRMLNAGAESSDPR